MAKRTASDIMEKAFITASPETSVFDLVNLFVKNRITAIPIINDKEELVGIVTDADLLYKKVKPHVPHYVNCSVPASITTASANTTRDSRNILACTACDMMTKDVIIAAPDADVEQIAGVMVAEHLKVIPIVEGKTHCRHRYSRQYSR